MDTSQIHSMSAYISSRDNYAHATGEGNISADVLAIRMRLSLTETQVRCICSSNLDTFIISLNADFSDVFQDTDRYSYVILNASDKVHFDELTSDSEPNDFEITIKVDNDLKNKKKIALLENADFIFCFGLKAQKYYTEMKSKSNLKVASVNCCHLGTRGLNNCEELKTYLSDRRMSEELSNEETELSNAEKVNYLYELKKEQIEKMVKKLNSSSQEQKS